MNNIMTGTMLVATLVVTGCSNQTVQQQASQGVSAKPLASLTEAQQQQRDLAVSAKDKMFQSLLGELVGAIQTLSLIHISEPTRPY